MGRPTRVWHVCVHEAAHAIVGRAVGHMPLLVTIDPQARDDEDDALVMPSDAGGLCRAHVPAASADHRTGREILRIVVDLAAGTEAERQLLGRDVRGDAADRRRIGRLLAALTESAGVTDPDAAQLMERHLRRCAARLVRRHMAAIRYLAGELLTKRTLQGAALERAMAAAMN